MVYRVLADLVLIVWVMVYLFALLGALGVIKWRRLMGLHIPIAFGCALAMLSGMLFPLAPLAHWLRLQAGIATHKIGIVEQYLSPLLYPTPLTRKFQIMAGAVLLVANGGLYGWAFWRRHKQKRLIADLCENVSASKSISKSGSD